MPAKTIQPGDTVVVAVGSASQGFAAGTVVANVKKRGAGRYTPAIEAPFLIVDDMVVPL